MNLKHLAASAALACLSGISYAESGSPPEPLAFKGFPLGALRTDLNLSGLQCHENTRTEIQFSCFHSARLNPSSDADFATIAGVRAQLFHLSFFDDRLAAITIEFDRADYRVVVGALTQKYGEPAEKDAVYSNSYGAKFTGKQADWSLPSGTISAEQNVQSKPSSVRFTMADFAKLLRDKRDAKAAAGKDDL